MFLSASEIVELVRKEEIRIAFYAIKDGDGNIKQLPGRRYVKVDKVEGEDAMDASIREYFFASLEPDSLIFHIGPYATSDDINHVKATTQHVREIDGQQIYSIKNAGSIKISPQSFALIGTNEYVEIGGQVGASLFSNVRNTDVGLGHISTMIDPTWHGKLQIGISNPTKFSKELKYLDALCALRFHRLKEAPPEYISERFKKRRPHFGDDWWDIEQEPGRRYFQLRREYAPDGEYAKKIAAELRTQKWFAYLKQFGAAIGILAAGGLVFSFAKLYSKMEDASNYAERVVKLEGQQKTLDEISKTFHIIQSGTQRVSAENRRDLQFVIPFKLTLDSQPFVGLTVPQYSSSEYSARIVYQSPNMDGKKYNAALVTIQVSGEVKNNEYILISWFIATPRAEKSTEAE